MNSVLDTIKHMLGIESECTHFDDEIIVNINSVLMALNQFGLGPKEGLFISDKETTWEELLNSRKDMECVKAFIYLKVRLLFDPPTNSFTIESIQRQIQELEWRIITQLEIPQE